MPDQTDNSNNVFIKCPQCGKVLQFKAFPNYKKARLKCPFCHYDNTTENYIQIKANKPEDGLSGGNNSEEEGTVTLTEVILHSLTNNQRRSLTMGENTIGRSSLTPKAKVTFDDPQKYLSRNHALITVLRTGNGKIQCRLSDNNSMNGTYIGNTRISSGTIVVVPAGQEFTLGRMKFVIEINDSGAKPMGPINNESGPTELL